MSEYTQRIARDQRTDWMADRHSQYYGRDAMMTNLDCINDHSYLEYCGEQLSHLAEYKNELELIQMWHWNIKHQATLATNSKLPFFIVVGYRAENCFWLIPGNEIAKSYDWAPKWCNTWISEANYVRILYWLRKQKVPQEILTQLSNKRPKIALVPNVQW